ncbi:hypothetical protein ACTUQ0_15640, partial [Listeria monocytogenes]|uniref:hypothetical protein n=1 Tax=Listeria monocytogenes TaxID=1639 RepID=UPI003FA49A73
APRLWHNLSMKCRFTSPVEYQSMIYGLDEGILACVDPADGKRRWKDGRYGQGQLLRCGDLLLITAENGKLV